MKNNNCCCEEELKKEKNECCCEKEKKQEHDCCHHQKHIDECCSSKSHKSNCCESESVDSCCGTGGGDDCGCGKSKVKNIWVSISILIVSAVSLVLSYFEILQNKYFDFAFIAIVLCGVPIIINSVKTFARKFKITAGLLVTFALIASLFIKEYFAAGEVALIMQLGGFLEDVTVKRAKNGIKRLLSLTPNISNLKTKDGIIEVKTSTLKIDDIVIVKAGEVVPTDGIILVGSSAFNQSSITGESLPVDKSVGDDVFEGTINTLNSIEVKVTKVGEDSSIKKMAKLVQDAEKSKAPIVLIADKIASIFVPLAIVIAVVVGLVTKDLERAVTIMVVFCPCSLVLATPTAIMASIGRGSKNGMIIKSGEAIEKIAKIKAIAFDKTGTITSGNLSLSDIKTSIDEKDFIKVVASAEKMSEHPISAAIVEYANEKKIKLVDVINFKNVVGKGLECEIDGRKIIVGSANLLNEKKIKIDFQSDMEKLQAQGKKTLLVSVDKKNVGVIGIADIIKEYSAEAIRAISDKFGLETIMITGDNALVGSEIAKAANITKVIADCLPEDKVTVVKEYIAQGKNIAMVGDGINDAPALASASVGIAMGAMGSDITVDACDIVLMTDDLSTIPKLLRHVKKTMFTIKSNITFSMAVNFIAIGLATFGLINPVIGALIHNAGSVIVVLNAALLYGRK